MFARRLAVLGHPKRLAVFSLLMRRYPDRVTAGDLAAALDLKASTLSAYLAALHQAGLVNQERRGASLRYCVAMEEARELIDVLVLDCCRGRPDLCAPVVSRKQDNSLEEPSGKINVLFICTGNSARSIFAEALLRHAAGERINAYSAGLRPRQHVNPFALKILEEKGIDIAPLRTKTLAAYQGPGALRMDVVLTVCDQAANEECPAWKGRPISAHWGVSDPVGAQGSEDEKDRAFRATYGALKSRIDAFTALPIASLDRISLQHAIDAIGRDRAEVTP